MPNVAFTATDDAQPRFKIGAVSGLSGVPVSTLRIWESRYAAFCPAKTDSQHRLYTQADADKAALLRQLTEQGHGISRIASLDVPALQRLAWLAPPKAAMPQPLPAALQSPSPALTLVLVGGDVLAQRLQSPQWLRRVFSQPPQPVAVHADLAQAVHAIQAAQGGQGGGAVQPPAIWLIKVNTLNDDVRHQMATLRNLHPQARCVLLYSYGPQAMVAALRHAGAVLRREPVSDDELAELLRDLSGQPAALTMATLANPSNPASPDTVPTQAQPASPAPVPPARYSEQTLRRVASLSGAMQCECPRHVAELIAQLASFEQYSRDCLNKSPADARLHAHLHHVSGSARALFEQALEMVAQHEGIELG